MTSIAHNNRDEEDEKKLKDIDKHIRWEDVDKNVVLESKDIRELYHEEFHTDVIKYNIRQKRNDRKIDQEYGGYYKKIRDEKGKGNSEEQREFIVQFGTKDDEPFNVETSNEMFTQYLDEFKERNPDMKVYNAVIHNDEATPHMHINIVPVGRGYKRGVASKPSFTRALETSGVTFDEFMDQERDSLANIMKQHTNEDRKLVGSHDYIPPAQYRETMGRANEEMGKASEMMETAREKSKKASDSIVKANGHVGKINKHYEDIREQKQELTVKSSELGNRERELGNREKNLESRETTLESSQNEFKRYVEQKERELKDKEQQNTLRASQIDSKGSQLKNREIGLERRETALEEREKGVDDKFWKRAQQYNSMKKWYSDNKQTAPVEEVNRRMDTGISLVDDDLEELNQLSKPKGFQR